MYSAFIRLLNMSAMGAIATAVVIVLRLLLRKVPKKYICILWAVVALRLVCPVSISSAASAFNYIGNTHYIEKTTTLRGDVEYIRLGGGTEKPQAEIILFTRADSDPTDGPTVTAHTSAVYLPTLMQLWAAGAGILVLYAAASYLGIRKTVRESIKVGRRIYLCDHIPSPFILGIVKPRIYLPSELSREQQRSVIAHERAHIARLDHWWKPLGYGILCIHWFNPLVWIGYGLLCRDIEMACDEKVIAAMKPSQKQEYAAVLLTCSMPRKFITACPLAFGEAGVKQRIRGILNYRKPSFWVILIAAIVCICAAVGFLTNPKVDAAVSPFYLTVETDIVYSLRVTTPNGSGGCTHADGTPYQMGETVCLEPMRDLTSWKGVTLEAMGQDGEVIWSCTVPEELAEFASIEYDTWMLENKGSDASGSARLMSGPMSPRIGDLNFKLFTGTTLQIVYDKQASTLMVDTFLVDGKTIGGVYQFPMETEPGDGDLSWIKSLPLPEWEMENIGYFADSTAPGQYRIELFSDVPPGTEKTVRNRHDLYYSNGYIYDLWFDERDPDSLTRDSIRRTVYLTNAPTDEVNIPHSQSDARNAAAKAVASFRRSLEESGAAYIISQLTPEGAKAPASRITDCSIAGDRVLCSTVYPQPGSIRTEAVLIVDGERYTNEGHEYDEGDIQWTRSPGEFTGPWLLSLGWSVDYVDTVPEDGGVSYLFHTDDSFPGEKGTPGYDIRYHFGPSGQFESVKLTINAGQPDAYTVIESVLNTDAGTIGSWIDREYQRAIQ